MLISQLCWHVKGLYTLKGSIRHHKEKMAAGRDKVCYAIHNRFTSALFCSSFSIILFQHFGTVCKIKVRGSAEYGTIQ